MMRLSRMKKILILLFAFSLLLSSCGSGRDSDELFSSEIYENSDESEDISYQTPDDSLADNGIIDVSFVSTKGGYVTGGIKQELIEGELSQSVTAHPFLCYRFEKWSDGVTEQTRSKESFDKDTVVTAVFEYTGLPELYIEYKGGISQYSSKKATYTMKNASGLYEFEDQTGIIQGRGNSSWRHAKKPYKIKFDEAINVLGIGEDAKRDWVIMANHGDQSLFRNYFAYNLGFKAGIGYKSTLIEVYLNGKYNGVYMLTGKVEESRLDVDNEDGGFIVELDEYASGKEGKDYFFVGKEKYTLKSDFVSTSQVNTIKNCIIEIENAIKNEDRAKIESLVDIDSCVDMYLLQEYVKNTDVGWSSFYMYKEDGDDKLRFGPGWDFDIAFGNDYRLDKGSYENIYVGRYSGFYQQNWWYIYLCRMPWFRELALERWNKSFRGYIEETYSELKEYAELNWEELKNNFVRWEIFGKQINCEPASIRKLRSYLEHYRYFTAWLELRLEWLDNCFNNEEIWIKEVNDRTYPQYKGGKLPEIELDPDANDFPVSSQPPSRDETSEEGEPPYGDNLGIEEPTDHKPDFPKDEMKPHKPENGTEIFRPSR